MFEENFPRKLNDDELNILFRILPIGKSGYREYREKISEFFLTGKGSDEGSYILSKNSSNINNEFITPVFAAGTFSNEINLFDVIIHEADGDNIEIEVEIKDKSEINSFKNIDVVYSEWEPGNSAPGDNSHIREVILIKNKYLIAIAPVHQRLWLHNYETGVNHFITTGAFYNNLCFVKNIREPATVFNTKLLFQNLDNYTDNELISAFYLYNKSLRKFRIDMPAEPIQEKKEGLFKKFLKKDNN